jgi:DNA primase
VSPLISQETIDKVRQFPDIVGIISDYVILKKRGRNYVGLCPFHAEKTPSFSVSPEKQLWHCFGCHKSGDHVGFIMQMDNVSFAEAITHIAQKAGIPIVEEERPKWMTQEEHRYKERLELLYAVRVYFESQLPNSRGEAYLYSRGVSAQMIQRFHLGFSGATDAFLAYAKTQGWSTELLIQIGVLSQSESGGVNFRFKQRVIFPILDSRGRTVGFGGRSLDEDPHMPKYLNTEETPLFTKRKILFGLDHAKSAIQKQKTVLVMEGYLDVIAAHQAGITNAVATMGTALSNEHAQLLRRFVDQVYLVFDADQAGQQAIERGFETLRQHELQVFVVPLGAKDPGEWLTNEGPEPLLKAVENALPMVGFYLERLRQKWSGRIESVPEILDQLFPLLEREKDPLVQRHYLKQIAKTFQVDSEEVLAKFKSLRYNTPRKGSPPKRETAQPVKTRFQKAAETLIYCMASDLDSRATIIEACPLVEFQKHGYGEIVALISQNTGDVNQDLVRQSADEETAKKLSRILLEKEGEGGLSRVQEQVEACVAVIKESERIEKVDGLKAKIKAAEAENQEAELESLLRELQALIQRPE